MTKYEQLLADLKEQEKAILADQAKARGNKKFKCTACDKMHTISKCDAFTFPRWESGSGYDDGRWWEGEIYIRCPETQKYNRCYFKSPSYPHYSSYEHSTDMQFKRLYKPLFKTLTQREDDKRLNYSLWDNNHYFDENHKKFDLHVKGVDK